MAFHTKIYEAYRNIRVKPNQPCNYLNRGHKSKVNIFGRYDQRVISSLGDFKVFTINEHGGHLGHVTCTI